MVFSISEFFGFSILLYVGVWAIIKIIYFIAGAQPSTRVYLLIKLDKYARLVKYWGWLLIVASIMIMPLFISTIYVISEERPDEKYAVLSNSEEDSLKTAFSDKCLYALFSYQGHRCEAGKEYIFNSTDTIMGMFWAKRSSGDLQINLTPIYPHRMIPIDSPIDSWFQTVFYYEVPFETDKKNTISAINTRDQALKNIDNLKVEAEEFMIVGHSDDETLTPDDEYTVTPDEDSSSPSSIKPIDNKSTGRLKLNPEVESYMEYYKKHEKEINDQLDSIIREYNKSHRKSHRKSH